MVGDSGDEGLGGGGGDPGDDEWAGTREREKVSGGDAGDADSVGDLVMMMDRDEGEEPGERWWCG